MLDDTDFSIDVEFLIREVLTLADATDDLALAARLREIAKDTLALIARPWE